MNARAAVVIVFAGLVSACISTNLSISLEERFERVALRNDAGKPDGYLRKWTWPIRVRYEGPAQYNDAVAAHTKLLGELTGLEAYMTDLNAYEHQDGANMIVQIAPRAALRQEANAVVQRVYGRNAGQFTCFATSFRPSAVRAFIGIVDSLGSDHIRSCIAQEMTQSLGLAGDLDGRIDTNFTSTGRIPSLTEADIALIRIFYDDRLTDGMRREDALRTVRQIVAELQAEQ